MRIILMLLVSLAVGGCEGPVGPVGPQGDQGEQGEQGEPGPGTRLTFLGQITADGTAVIALPAEAGTATDMPAISVYIADAPDGPWLAVNDGYTDGGTPWFAVIQDSGVLHVVVLEATPGVYYQVVVVF